MQNFCFSVLFTAKTFRKSLSFGMCISQRQNYPNFLTFQIVYQCLFDLFRSLLISDDLCNLLRSLLIYDDHFRFWSFLICSDLFTLSNLYFDSLSIFVDHCRSFFLIDQKHSYCSCLCLSLTIMVDLCQQLSTELNNFPSLLCKNSKIARNIVQPCTPVRSIFSAPGVFHGCNLPFKTIDHFEPFYTKQAGLF